LNKKGEVIKRHREQSYTAYQPTRPCELVVSIEFAEERRAIALEQYLKSGSGVTFARRFVKRNNLENSTAMNRVS
jgi:predicted GIY-YIG superfamily endonuclease